MMPSKTDPASIQFIGDAPGPDTFFVFRELKDVADGMRLRFWKGSLAHLNHLNFDFVGADGKPITMASARYTV